MISKKPVVSYFEKRTVNIADYESVEFCLTISGVDIESRGYGNKKATVSASEKEIVQDSELLDETIKNVVKKVKTTLNDIESKIRLQTASWSGMNFDTEAKMVTRQLKKDYEYKGHFNKRMNLGDDE